MSDSTTGTGFTFTWGHLFLIVGSAAGLIALVAFILTQKKNGARYE